MEITLLRILECMGDAPGEAKRLAECLGLEPNVITAWKNGRSRSYEKYLREIARRYGVTVGYLLGGPRQEPSRFGIDNALLDEVLIAYRVSRDLLTEQDKQDIVQLIRERAEWNRVD